jgi:aspartate/methionine/tyrosine aminotransferase
MMVNSKISARANRLVDWRALLHDPLAKISATVPDMILTGGGEWSTEIEMPEHLVAAAQAAIRGRPQYTDGYGIMPLRSAIARKLSEENGIEADPESEIVVTNGGTEAICNAILALVDPGDEVILGDPYYLAIYQPNVLLANGKLVNVPTGEKRYFRLDPDAVEAAITPKTKVICVTTPDNPTGASLSREILERIADIAERHDLLIIADEMYEKFVYDGREHVSIASLPSARERTITVNGFSKTYGLTGYRIGFLTGPRALIQQIAKIRNATSLCASEVSQKVALAALEGPQEWLQPILEAYEESRNVFVDGLGRIEGVRITPPDGAIYVFPNIEPFGMTSDEMTKYLLREARVANRPGSYFGPAGEGYVRFNITPTMPIAKEAVSRVQEALDRLPIVRD